MSLKGVFILLTIAFTLTGCAAKITSPSSGPTSKLTVEVANFSQPQRITNNQNVYFQIGTADGSWGGEQLIKAQEPKQSFVIPANEELGYSLTVMQGGGGFSSSCALHLSLVPPENANLSLKFIFERLNGDEKVTGCRAELYAQDKLLGSYKGGANIIKYKVKILY